MSPDNAAILCYHLESLYARMREHCENVEKVVEFLVKHKKVSRVYFPSKGIDAARNKALMPHGFGSLMAFDIKGGRKEAKDVVEGLKLFWHAANIGESRSLVIHPATTTHGQMNEAEIIGAGISMSTIRISIGREYADDLIADLAQVLDKVKLADI